MNPSQNNPNPTQNNPSPDPAHDQRPGQDQSRNIAKQVDPNPNQPIGPDSVNEKQLNPNPTQPYNRGTGSPDQQVDTNPNLDAPNNVGQAQTPPVTQPEIEAQEEKAKLGRERQA